MAKSILKLSGIGKNYGPVVAAREINLDVAEGEFLTFLGPSGSGKTTTLMMVAGFTEPSQGRIDLNDKPLDPVPVWQRNIGMVFQHYALFPHMTVVENVTFPLEMRGVAKTECRKQVQHALEMVGLTGFDNRMPKELSGGQQQRVALARAMVFKPPLLLMDEPLGALDRKLREHMQLEIMHLHKDMGTTVLYVTHDQEEALVMSDRVAVFNKGEIEQIGTPRALYEEPETKFVADFIGETNFIAGKIDSITGDMANIAGLQGQLGCELSKGEASVLAIRPERLHFIDKNESGSDDNYLVGSVKELIYLGQSRKAVVVMENGTEITVLEQAARAESTSIEPGSQVKLGFRSQDARVLADV